MKTLLLLRHAKSSWADAALPDFDRPLNQRGLNAAPKVGAFLRKKKIRPELVLSSPAVRARETTRLVCDAAGLALITNFDQRIYEASARQLLNIVTEIQDQISIAILVGHNPGFEELLEILTDESHRMPTAALACIELDVQRWIDVSARSGRLAWLMKPKNLE